MRNVSALQASLLSEPATVPVYLVELDFTHPERLSTNGDQVVAGEVYAGGDVALGALGNWTQARLRLRPTAERVARLMAPDWRNTACRIWQLSTADYPELIEPGYVEPGYALQGRVQAEPLQLLDGVLASGGVSQNGFLELSVTHRALVRRWTPRLRIAPPLCNHLPPPGTRIEWAGEVVVLEARK